MPSWLASMRYASILLLLLFVLPLVGQTEFTGARNKDAAILVHMSYGPELSLADLGDRFNNNFGIGLGLGYSAQESPWIFSLEGKYFFGSEVEEDVLAGLRTDAGFIIGTNRFPADINLRMRGLFVGLRAGRIFALGDNPRAGIKVALGAGYFSHRIRIQFDPMQTVNQLVGDYRKGYDRLSAGPALSQFVGYYQLSKNGRINFFAGVEAIQALTTNQRDYDFATAGTLEEDRLDISLGIRAGLILPLYNGSGEDIFYR